MSTAVGNSRLPQEIVCKLRQVIRRMRVVIMTRGTLAVVAVALAALIGIMAIDATLTLFSSATRWGLSLAALGITAAAGYRFLVRPLSQTFGLARVARMVERHHPELQERISSAVELLTSGDREDLLGSPELIGELTREATFDAQKVKPQSEFRLRSARPFFFATCSLALVLITVFALWPREALVLMGRAVAPHAAIGNLGSIHITVLPGDTVCAADSDLQVEVTVENQRTHHAEFRRLGADGVETVEPMTRVEGAGGRTFTLTVPAGNTSFNYRVLAGKDALSRYYECKVVPRPAIAQLNITYDYPSYTGLNPDVERGASGEISTLAGTTLTISTVGNKRLHTGLMTVNGTEVPNPESTVKDGVSVFTWQYTLKPETQGHWTIQLTDRHGLTSLPVRYTIEAVPDQPPTLTVSEPAQTQLQLRRTERLPILYVARDDYGIAAVDLVVTIDQQSPRTLSMPLPKRHPVESRVWLGRAVLNLRSLPVAQAQQVVFRLQVSDALPPSMGGPQQALSKPYTIKLSDEVAGYIEQQLLQKQTEIQKALAKAMKELNSAKANTQALQQQLPKDKGLQAAARDHQEKAREHVNRADTQLRDLAAKLDRTLLQPVADALAKTAEKHTAPAREELDSVKLTEKYKERLEHAKKADRHVADTIKAVQKVLAEMKDTIEKARLAKELDDLARRERELADAAEAMKKQDPADAPADDWKKQQEEMAQEIGKTVKKEMPQAARDALDQQAKAAQKFAHEAKELEGEQKQLHEATRATAEDKPDKDIKEDLAKRIQDQQKRIAAEADKLAEQIEAELPEAKTPHQDAADAATQAAQAMDKNDMDKAAEAGKQAAEKLDQTAQDLNKPKDPAGDPKPNQSEKALADKADQLAEQQKSVNKQVQALEKGNLDKVLQEMQQDLARRAEALAEQTQKAEAMAKAMDPEGATEQDAERAADQMAMAAKKAEEAGEQLPPGEGEPQKQPGEGGEGEPKKEPGEGGEQNQAKRQQAAESQKQAAEAMAQAAEALQGLHAKLEQQLKAQPPAPPPGDAAQAQAMAEAMQQAAEAAQAQSAEQANQAAQQAAQALQQAADAAAKNAGIEALPPESMHGYDNERPNVADPLQAVEGSDTILNRLKGLGLTSDDWLRLPDNLRNQILQAAGDRAPAEYRDLVQRYFRELARRGSTPPDNGQ